MYEGKNPKYQRTRDYMSKLEVNSGFQICLVPPSDWKLLQKWYDGYFARQQLHPIWYTLLVKWLHIR